MHKEEREKRYRVLLPTVYLLEFELFSVEMCVLCVSKNFQQKIRHVPLHVWVCVCALSTCSQFAEFFRFS